MRHFNALAVLTVLLSASVAVAQPYRIEMEDRLIAPTTLSADWSGTDAATPTSSEVANSTLKFKMDGRTSISIQFDTVPTTATYSCAGSIDGNTWYVVSCTDFTLGNPVTRSITITNPAAANQYSVHVWSGMRWFRLRQTAHTGASAVITVNTSYGRFYDALFGITGYNGLQVPPRFIGMAASDYSTSCPGSTNCLVWLKAGIVAPGAADVGLTTRSITYGLGSGATAGVPIAPVVCDSFAPVDIVTATTTLVITGVSGRHVRICSINLITTAANNVAMVAGTGATCATSTAGMAGGITSAEGWNWAANGGIAQGSGVGTIMSTDVPNGATGDSVCIITSAATQLSGTLGYAIY